MASVGDAPGGRCTQAARNLAYFEILEMEEQYGGTVLEDTTTRMQVGVGISTKYIHYSFIVVSHKYLIFLFYYY